MKRLKRRVVIKPPQLMGWCAINYHAGWSGNDVMLCPGGKTADKLTCECECHDDPEMQQEALEMAREQRAEIIKTPQPQKKIRRLKRVKK